MSRTALNGMAQPAEVALPSWQNPKLLMFRATIGASGAPTVVAGRSYPGCTVTREDVGIYTIGFPGCLHLDECPDVKVFPDDPTDVSDMRVCNVDDANTSATGGTLRVHCASVDATEGADDEVVSGSVLVGKFWVDLG